MDESLSKSGNLNSKSELFETEMLCCTAMC